MTLRLALRARSGQGLLGVVTACWVVAVFAQPQAQLQGQGASEPPTKEQLQFFESRIRPILANNCYQCHSPSTGTPRGGLELDWKGGWEQGGNSGAAIVPGDPDASALIKAVRHDGRQMPPGRKLADEQVNDLVAWVRMGAPDPRTARPGAAISGAAGSGAASATAYGGSGKKHWAFQPVTRPTPPRVTNEAWVANDIDRFVLAKLEANGMTGSERADKRTLIRRVYYDVIGLPPTPEQVDAFLTDTSPTAFEKVVDALLASPRYGERWGRHWLDVARYSDSKGQFDRRRGETSIYPYAWTYRDYVIKAFNEDLPYDQFIREQIAADRLFDGKNPAPLAAMGFLTLGDRYNGNAAEIINDRIDVTSKAFLGLTVTCARCHDHKFDPIPTADYYSLYGVFASSGEPVEKPIIAQPISALYPDYLAKRRALDEQIKTTRDGFVKELYGDYRQHAAVYLFATTMGQKEGAAYAAKNGADPALVANWTAMTRGAFRQGIPIFGVWTALARIPPARFDEQSSRVLDNLNDIERLEQIHPIVRKTFEGKSPGNMRDVANAYGKLFARTDAEWETVVARVLDAALLRFLPRRSEAQLVNLRQQSDLLELVEPGAPPRAHILVDNRNPADAPILVRGQVETPGETVPRRFLEVLSGSNRPRFREGSGRLELANAIASKTNPLTARVIVNRVWQHHFGEGFVSTPDDLGNQSTPPMHPELLDWLATRLMADGWSLKKLHKVILLSSTWQQGSRNNAQFAAKDPFNRLLWRANIRRLEFEPLRDFILSVGGVIDLTIGGHPVDLAGGTRPAAPGRGGRGRGSAAGLLAPDPRRTVYGYVDRADMAEVFNTFDFPSPNASTGRRYETIVPQQALFLMNSPLVIEQVRRVVTRDSFATAASDEERIRSLYELFFQRPPRDVEIRAGQDFLRTFQPEGAAPTPQTALPAGRGQAGRGVDGGRGRAARGRGAVQPAPVRRPLSGWQEYAHALLLTNEALFIN